MKTKKLRGALGIILAAVMIFTLVPAAVMAAEYDEQALDTFDEGITVRDSGNGSSGGSGSVTINGGNVTPDVSKTEGAVLKTENGGTSEEEDSQIHGELAVTASGAYDLWVGGVQVRSENLSGSGWSYDPETKTLTLNGANIKKSNQQHTTGINTDIDGLTIELKGTNTIAGGLNFGITNGNEKTLNFKGEGSLQISAGIGIKNGSGTKDVNGGTINVNGGDINVNSSSTGLSNEFGKLNVNGGSLRLSNSYDYTIVNTSGSIKVNGGTFSAGSKLWDAITADGTVILDDTVEITKPEGGSLYTNGSGSSWIIDDNGDNAKEFEIKEKAENIGSSEGSGQIPGDIGAPAVVSYDLWVGGVQVTSNNLSGSGWTYDPAEKTLTLKGLNINVSNSGYDASINNNIDGLTINLEGTNKITGNVRYGIANGKGKTLEFDGGGYLSCKAGIKNDGGTINVINGTNIVIDSPSTGISNKSGIININSGGNLKVNNSYGNGITNTSGSITINGGTFSVFSYQYKAITADGTVSYDHNTYGIIEPAGGILHEENGKSWIEDGEGNIPEKVVIGETVVKEKYDLWVNNVQATNVNMYNILKNNGTGTASYDPETKTLTLGGANITKAYQYWIPTDPYYAGIYTKINGMTINLKNSNKIDMTGAEEGQYMYGLVNSANVHGGSGSLH